MKNILVLLLMLLLPLQASWSAAAVFCQHESKTSWHWGHHQDEENCQGNVKEHDKKTKTTISPNVALDNASSLDDPNNSKHKLNFATHADHLNINQQALKHVSNINSGLKQFAYSVVFVAIPSAIYQSPVLEQPEPPIWPA